MAHLRLVRIKTNSQPGFQNSLFCGPCLAGVSSLAAADRLESLRSSLTHSRSVYCSTPVPAMRSQTTPAPHLHFDLLNFYTSATITSWDNFPWSSWQCHSTENLTSIMSDSLRNVALHKGKAQQVFAQCPLHSAQHNIWHRPGSINICGMNS